jgi:Tfp pilus assembly protein PilP
MRMKSNFSRLSCGAVALVALCVYSSGCDMFGSETPKPVVTAKPAVSPKAKVEKPAPAAPAKAARYERPDYPKSTRRNPFRPNLETVMPSAIVGAEVRPMDPLELYSVSELKLVAIISEVSVPKAMFISPDGVGHLVKEGDRIGRNGARVSDIRNNEVELTEGGGDEEEQAQKRRIKLRDLDEIRSQQKLSREERDKLQEILKSEEGRDALNRTYRNLAPSSNAIEGTESSRQQRAPQVTYRGVSSAPAGVLPPTR